MSSFMKLLQRFVRFLMNPTGFDVVMLLGTGKIVGLEGFDPFYDGLKMICILNNLFGNSFPQDSILSPLFIYMIYFNEFCD